MKEPRFCLDLLPSAYLPPNFIPGPSQPYPAALNSDNMQRHEPIRIYWKSSLHTRRDKGLLITGNNCFSLSKEKLKIMKMFYLRSDEEICQVLKGGERGKEL